MKIIAWIGIVLGTACVLWLLGTQIGQAEALADGGLGGFDYVLGSVAGFITP